MKKMKKFLALGLAVMMALSLLACGNKSQGEASVQSVSMICGLGSGGLAERFAGIVSARSESKIEKDDNKVIAEILVKEGDAVTAGQVLFTYDAEQGQLTLEKAELELEQLKAGLSSKETELEKLKKEEEKAAQADKLSYTLAIQECETAIREANYNIGLKEKELARTEASLENMEVTSPVDGKVTELNEEGGYDNYGNPLSFMTVLETGTYRVKGIINENNVFALGEGTPVLIRSRLDSAVTWDGYISMIDWENPEKQNNNYYYGEVDEGTSSSNYPFYVELENPEGLLLGQHVYIEPSYGSAGESSEALNLPEYYISDPEGNAWVWAENSKGKLEKRSVTLGNYDEMMGTREVLSGLAPEDFIAFPEEGLKAGMVCTEYDESVFEADGGFTDEGAAYEIPADGMVTNGAVAEFAVEAPVPVPMEG